jgi:4-hydroxy-tetrahydrodipicolinate synthase
MGSAGTSEVKGERDVQRVDTCPGHANSGGAIDEAAVPRFVDWQIENGSSALVPCGTTGESATMSIEEHDRVVAICIEQAAGRVPVIAGCGSNDDVVALSAYGSGQAAGADAALVVLPYYNRPNQEGLIAHFTYLAEQFSDCRSSSTTCRRVP